MAAVDPAVANAVAVARRDAMRRDERMTRVRLVREGEIQSLWPDQFSDRFPQSVVANFVDAVARDLAEVIAPLPTLDCSAGAMKTAVDKQRAEKKNRIGRHFWDTSRLDIQMFYGGDQYLTYGFLPGLVEADYAAKRPKITLEDPCGAYYEMDRFGKVLWYARVWCDTPAKLAAQFPELATQILERDRNGRVINADTEIDVVRHIDATTVTLYLPDRASLILDSYQHGIGRCPAVVALRPGLNREPRGQFDDVLWVQMARAVMAQLTLEAAHKAVQAPIQVPSDVTSFQVGPDAVIQTDGHVQRVQLQVPSEAFALEAQLNEELKVGARYPDARLGVAEASVITGKGVQALMGGFDTQIKSAQTILGQFLRDLTSLAFEVDEKVFPNKRETFNGTRSGGQSFRITYTPRTDIAGDYECDVTYGFASGTTPQNALVMMLQARGDGLIDRDTVRRELPWDLDADQVQRNLDVQEMEDGVKQGVLAALQSAGQMLAQNMVDEAMLFFGLADEIIRGRQNGKPLNEIVSARIATYQQQQQAQAAAQAAAQASAGGGGAAPDGLQGVGADGLPPGVAPGQAGLAPGGMPTIQSLTASMRNGQGELNTSVRRRLPTG